jgi:hypothetical protein
VGRRHKWGGWSYAGRCLVTLLATLSLVTTLASRTFHSAGATAAVHSYPSSLKIQHRDKDAYRWSVPPPTFVLFQSSQPVISIAPQEEPVSSLRIDDPCLNRPPPSV